MDTLLSLLRMTAFVVLVPVTAGLVVYVVVSAPSLYSYGAKPGNESGCAVMAAGAAFLMILWQLVFG